MLFRRAEPEPARLLAAPAEQATATALTASLPLHGQMAPQSSLPASTVSLAITGDDALPVTPVDAVPPAATAQVTTPPQDHGSLLGGGAPDGLRALDTAITPQAPATDAPAVRPNRVHVVHNGDTLERLAERYLGDATRSLELFDLNRGVLENPHLLQLGTELQIPVPAEAE